MAKWNRKEYCPSSDAAFARRRLSWDFTIFFGCIKATLAVKRVKACREPVKSKNVLSIFTLDSGVVRRVVPWPWDKPPLNLRHGEFWAAFAINTHNIYLLHLEHMWYTHFLWIYGYYKNNKVFAFNFSLVYYFVYLLFWFWTSLILPIHYLIGLM